MLRRVFRARDGRVAIGWRLAGAFVLWFVVLVLTEEVLAGALSRWVGGLAVIAASVPLVYFFRRAFDHRGLAAMRLSGLPGGFGHLAVGFLLGALLLGGALVASVAVHTVRLGPGNPHGLGVPAAAGYVAGFAVTMLGVAFTEELFFRGYVLQNLGERLPLWGALLVSAVLFALGHGLSITSPLQLVDLTVAGIWLGLLRLGTGTLWLAIGVHAGWDFVESGVIGGRLQPAQGPVTTLESTAAGRIALVIALLVTLVLVLRRRRPVDWRGRLDEAGEVPVLVPSPAPGYRRVATARNRSGGSS